MKLLSVALPVFLTASALSAQQPTASASQAGAAQLEVTFIANQPPVPGEKNASAPPPLVIDGKVEAILLPAGYSAVLTASPNDTAESVVPAGSNATEFTQQTKTSYEWSTSSGLLKPLARGSAAWVPAEDTGTPARITISMTQLESISTDDGVAEGPESTAQADVVILPSLKFDRDGDGTLAGHGIGIYPNEYGETAPAPVARNPDSYAPPTSFYLLNKATSNLYVSPHATLKSLNPEVFSEDEYRLIAMSPEIVRLWEALITVTQRNDEDPGALKVLRGFVSPNERARLERLGVNLAEFTRYMYGDALAIVYDENEDYRMDDLNGDGEINGGDSEVLGAWVQDAMKLAGLQGGVGIAGSFEGPNNVGTPYVHADTRGWSLQWRE